MTSNPARYFLYPCFIARKETGHTKDMLDINSDNKISRDREREREREKKRTRRVQCSFPSSLSRLLFSSFLITCVVICVIYCYYYGHYYYQPVCARARCHGNIFARRVMLCPPICIFNRSEKRANAITSLTLGMRLNNIPF